MDEQGRFHGIVSKAGPIAWKTFEPGNSSCVAERLQWVGAAAAGEGEAGRMGSTVRPACERCQVEVVSACERMAPAACLRNPSGGRPPPPFLKMPRLCRPASLPTHPPPSRPGQNHKYKVIYVR